MVFMHCMMLLLNLGMLHSGHSLNLAIHMRLTLPTVAYSSDSNGIRYHLRMELIKGRKGGRLDFRRTKMN